MNADLEKQLCVTTEKEGVLLKLCLHILLFFRETDDTLPKRQVYLDILDEHCALTGDRYRWTANPKTEKFKRLKNGIGSYIHPRDWLLDQGSHKPWNLLYHGGENGCDASDIQVTAALRTTRSVRPGFILLQFPVDQFDGQTVGLPELAVKWCAALKPEHGYAGLRLAESPCYADREGSRYSLQFSRRFQGLDVGSPFSHFWSLTQSIKGADWLTILSNDFVRKLGGPEAVRQGMGDLPVLPYGGGLILQTGPLPLVGDVEKGQDMSAYKRVARIVEPIRCKDHRAPYTSRPTFFPREEYQKWLARFSPQPE